MDPDQQMEQPGPIAGAAPGGFGIHRQYFGRRDKGEGCDRLSFACEPPLPRQPLLQQWGE
jgi:hypothetical protein